MFILIRVESLKQTAGIEQLELCGFENVCIKTLLLCYIIYHNTDILLSSGIFNNSHR